MPVRPRRQRRSLGVVWTPAVALALTIGPSPTGPRLSDETLREAWEAARPHLLAAVEDPADLWAWRVFDGPGAERPQLHPVGTVPTSIIPPREEPRCAR